METQITLPGTSPMLFIRFLGSEEKFLLSLDYPTPEKGISFLCLLNRIEAFTLWNFLDDILETPSKENSGK